jgi:hypothetical protein
MTIKLHRYYGDDFITKSVMEVWMDGEEEPRMVCEAREAAYRDYTETFPGASQYCLPVGRWRLKVGGSPYGPMGLRVPKCPGHRQVFIGWKWSRQCFEGEVLIGEPVMPAEHEGEWSHEDCRIDNGEETFRKLDKLVYEAYGKGEAFEILIED